MKNTPRPYSFIGLDEYVDESIALIREYEPSEGYLVGFSGGKDSIASLELVKMAGVRHTAYCSLTGMDPPEIVRFVRRQYPEVKVVPPKVNIYKRIVEKMPPLRTVRWCCRELKETGGAELGLNHRIVGIRAEESPRRASRPVIDEHGKTTLYKPIFRWPEWAVWEFIEQRKLPYPSLYDEGFGRVGCVVCPYTFGSSRNAVAKREKSEARWGNIWRRYKKACEEWFNSGKCKNRDIKYHGDFELFWEFYVGGWMIDGKPFPIPTCKNTQIRGDV